MRPLVVDVHEVGAVSLSTNGDACARKGSRTAPTARVTFMMFRRADLKGR
jgi:hypothetical protein